MEITLQAVIARHPAAAKGTAAALRGVSLSLRAGERLAVIGPSGAGKTTLLQVAAAALRPASGGVLLAGIDAWSQGTRALQRQRGRLFLAPQTPPLPPRQRVVTAVLAGRLPAWSLATSLRSLLYPVDIESAHEALARFDLADKLFARVDRLSGGERQRVGLARALVAPARLWLIDEPLAALDPARSRQAVDALLRAAHARGATLVASLHQVDAALAHFPRIVGLQHGRVSFDLPAAEVTPALLDRLYATPDGPGTAPESPPPAAALPVAVAVHCR